MPLPWLVRAALAAAARLVPRRDRVGWLCEWTAEFNHLVRTAAPGWRLAAARRLAMAVRHAWWLRWHPPFSPLRRGDAVIDHIRLAVRALVRQPSFTVPALVTLVLGLGANVAVFSVVEAVLLRPLPYPSADRLVVLRHRDLRTGLTKNDVSSTDMIDVAARQRSLEAVVPYGTGRVLIHGPGEPIDGPAIAAGAALFDVTGVRPALGRGLAAEDCRPGAAPVAILGHALWQKEFAGDPGILGRSIRIGPTERQIIGVAPSGFRLPPYASVDVILPLQLPATAPVPRTIGGWILAAGRLRSGTMVDAAVADLRAVSSQLATEFPATNQGTEYFAVSLRDLLIGDSRRPLLLLMGAVSVVLIIAFANVANLLLVRSMSRRSELALRVALGAERGRLFTQVLAENLVLAIVAGALGVVLATWGTSGLVALVPKSVQIPALADAGVNATVLAYALAITVASAVVFSLFAAAYADDQGAARALVSGRRQSMSRAARRVASTLVAAEVALAVILLVGAGLILRSFAALLAVDTGFDRSGVTTVGVQLPARYTVQDLRTAFYGQLIPALQAIPGVEAVGAAAIVPLTGNNWTVPFVRVDRPLAPGERAPDIGWQNASGGYFAALKIPIRSGRAFRPADTTGPPVVIISESVERRFFDPSESAVGHRVRLQNAEAEIVGVVGDIRRASLSDDPRADMYLPFERQNGPGTTWFLRSGSREPVPAEVIRDVIRKLEPNARIQTAMTLDEVAAESAGSTRLVMWLLSVFGGVALVLAAVGVYGVLSYAVRQRMREFGTRVALGATHSSILWLVLRQGSTIVAIGLAVGLGVSLLATRALSSLMYSVTASDPATLATAVTLLAMVTFIGCYLPARRAARVEPARILAE